MTRGRVAVVLGVLLAALAAAFVLRRGGDGPSAEIDAAAPGDRTGDRGSADARPAAVPLAAKGHAPAAPGPAGAPSTTGGARPEPPAFVVELLDAAGRPAADVEIHGCGTGTPLLGRTDDAGRARCPLRAFRTGDLLARVPGGATHLLGSAPWSPWEEDQRPVRWVLPRGVRVHGIVRLPTGEPAPGVEIARATRLALVERVPVVPADAGPPDADEAAPPQPQRRDARDPIPEVDGPWSSDAQGRFDLVLSGEAPLSLVFTRLEDEFGARIEAASARAVSDGAPRDVRLVPFVPPAGGVAARFVWADGTAPSMNDLDVDLRKRDDPQWVPAARAYGRATLADPSLVWRMDEGMRGRQLPPGTYRLVAQPRGYRVVERIFEVADAEVDLGDLVFDRGATLAGRLELPALAHPLRDLTVSLWPVDGPRERAQREVKVSPEGAFRVSGLFPGAYVLKAEGVDVLRYGLWFEALEPIDVPAEGRVLERPVRVVRMGSITVQFLQPPRPGTARWIGAEVRIDSADGAGHRRRATMGANGEVGMPIPCGAYDIVVERDRVEVRATVTVGPLGAPAILLLDGAPNDGPTLRPSMW